MPLPVVISTDQQDTLTLTAVQSSVTINTGITVAGPETDTGFGINATAGAGGGIVVYGSISGGGGIYDASSARPGYNIVIHRQGSITAATGYGIALQNQASITNHGLIVAHQIGISAGSSNCVIVNNGTIEADRGIQTYGNDEMIVNAGSILCSTDGIIVTGRNSAITNGGLIKAGRYGIIIVDGNSTENIITNSGSITAENLAIRGNTQSEQFINRGSVTGHIDLREGNDFLDNRLGTITGQIILGPGNDTGFGGAGDENFSDWTGNDFVDAGGGIDTLTYFQDAAQPVHVDLRIQTAQSSAWGTDIFLNFENVTGGAANDTITGSDTGNVLKGNAGSDSLDGAKGDDTLEGGDGKDVIEGGEGIDTASYDGAVITVVDLRLTTIQDTGHGIDLLSSIENVTGGSAGDALTGNDAANTLIGNGGVDILSGDAGNDILKGGDGGDIIRGGADDDQLFGEKDADLLSGDSGDDILNGGQGNDTLEGGAGANTAAFSGPRSNYTIIANSDGSLIVTDGRNGGDGVDQLKDISILQFSDQAISTLSLVNQHPGISSLILYGTAKADKLMGSMGDNVIFGQSGNDVLDGGSGNDRLFGRTGKDVLFGGSGQDVFVLDTRPNRKTNLDKFVDFNVKDDAIWLDNKYMPKIGKGTSSKPGAIKKAFFTIGEQAKDSNDYLVYNNKTGVLSYDADGSSAGQAVAIATLPRKLKVSYHDLFVI